MKKQLIIMDFTGVYNYEPFIRNQNCIWLDCRHLYGTECYCDEEGAASLKRLIADYPAEGIHFIDSGLSLPDKILDGQTELSVFSISF